jgi:hypothetical protein
MRYLIFAQKLRPNIPVATKCVLQIVVDRIHQILAAVMVPDIIWSRILFCNISLIN